MTDVRLTASDDMDDNGLVVEPMIDKPQSAKVEWRLFKEFIERKAEQHNTSVPWLLVACRETLERVDPRPNPADLPNAPHTAPPGRNEPTDNYLSEMSRPQDNPVPEDIREPKRSKPSPYSGIFGTAHPVPGVQR